MHAVYRSGKGRFSDTFLQIPQRCGAKRRWYQALSRQSPPVSIRCAIGTPTRCQCVSALSWKPTPYPAMARASFRRKSGLSGKAGRAFFGGTTASYACLPAAKPAQVSPPQCRGIALPIALMAEKEDAQKQHDCANADYERIPIFPAKLWHKHEIHAIPACN